MKQNAEAELIAIAQMIDHALLRPTLTDAEVEQGIALAIAYQVASICVMPARLAEVVSALQTASTQQQSVRTLASTVIGFPLGYSTTETKLFEAKEALRLGARELDMVVNVSWVKSGRLEQVEAEVTALAELCHESGAKLKLIFENAHLSDEEKRSLCQVATRAKVDWVKTSTGFASTGARLEDVQLMRAACPEEVQVKASGQVSDLRTLRLMRAAGVTRIGTSSTVSILEELRAELGLAPLSVGPKSAQAYV